MMQKKSLWAVVAAMLLMMVLAMNGVAEDEEVFTSGDYQYRILEDNAIEICRYQGEETLLEIPKQIENRIVEKIRYNAFYDCDSIEYVLIPNNVVMIESNPFLYCDNLKEIEVAYGNPVFEDIEGVLFNKKDKELLIYPTGREECEYEIPSETKVVNGFAFGMCKNIESIFIPNGVTEMKGNPFAGCSNIRNIEVSSEKSLFDFDGSALIDKSKSRIICYVDSKLVNEYKICKGIAEIGDSAFSYCRYLTRIDMTDDVVRIGNNAFFSCTSLNSIGMSKNVRYIGDYAFADCTELKKVEICDKTSHIGSRIFEYCYSLERVDFPDSVISMGEGIFESCIALKYVTLPEKITDISNYMFSGCMSLKDISIPDGVKTIGKGAFDSCSELEYIEIPVNVDSIGEFAFARCDSLKNLEIPENIQKINRGTFYWSTGLKNVILHDEIKCIDDYAFYNCLNIILTVPRDSYAAQYAKDNNLNYTYPDANDWLNN